ncbi:hypothetical protein HDU96_002663 [Phlyctochytrium bullatum]|nr:hypothetical protein HDU96_002663 [Phlyctochytrium bullatum]
MTIIHTVNFVAKADVTAAAIDALDFNALKAIDGVQKVAFGKTFTDRGGQYTHMLVVELASKEALAAYSPHPLHVEFIKTHLAPVFDLPKTMAMDIEVP